MSKYSTTAFSTMTLTAILALSGCSQSKEAKPTDTAQKTAEEVVTIVATDTKPYSSLMEQAKQDLKKQNVDLQITYMTDPLSINRVVAEKQYDLNYYQHEAYLDSVRFKNKWDLQPISYTFNTIFGGYSSKYKSIDQLPNGATITVPGDPANNARALVLLADSKLITLKPHAIDYQVSQRDIASNPKNFKIVEVEQPMLPTAYKDSDLTVITGVYADRAGLIPNRDALIRDKAAKKWTAVLVGNSESIKKPSVIKVQQYFDSKPAYDFIKQNYSDFVIWDKNN